MKKIKFLYYFSFFLLIGCTTIQYGNRENLFLEENEQKQDAVREFNLSYEYKVMGIPVKGQKSIPDAVFIHPDNKTMFLFVTFPKIGILKTDNYGKSFKSKIFRLSYLEKIYGYNEESREKEGKVTGRRTIPERKFGHFAVSRTDENKIIISFGPYIFLSGDKGDNWEVKYVFNDLENVNIRDIFVTGEDKIIIISENRIAISADWGKKWKKHYLKIADSPSYKIKYVTGFFDDSNDTLFASIKNSDDNDNELSRNTYRLFYKNENTETKSGLYYSTDFGLTWIKTHINVPVVVWKNNDRYYAGPVYPLCFYKYDFEEPFTDTIIYREARLDSSTKNHAEEYTKILLEMEPEDYDIISSKNNRLINFSIHDNNLELIDETDFNNLFTGINRLQYLDSIQWEENWYGEKKSKNFFYEYNPWRIFKLWTGMRTNDPVLYAKSNNAYFRIRPENKFFKIFIKYSVDKQIKINSINPFLKKKTDIEFFDPQYDPTNGFPVTIEYSSDSGKTWKEMVESKYVRNIVDPLNSKRSGYYWYKNIDQKKQSRLQISFGWTDGVDFLVYPLNIGVWDKDLIIRLNYFSVSKSYHDVYLIPVKVK